MSTTTVAATAKMTSTTAVAASLVLSSCVIANAFRQKKQFYPSVVYICKSNPSMAVSRCLNIHLYLLVIILYVCVFSNNKLKLFVKR